LEASKESINSLVFLGLPATRHKSPETQLEAIGVSDFVEKSSKHIPELYPVLTMGL
jgi:hypothetical protein